MRVLAVIGRFSSKPDLHPHGCVVSGSRVYPLTPGATATPLDLVVPQTVAGKTANGVGVGSPTPAILPGHDELLERFSDEGVHPHDFEDAA